MLVITEELVIFEFFHDALVEIIGERDSRWWFWWIQCWWGKHISVGTRGATLSGEIVSLSSTLRASGVVPPGGESGYSGTLRAA